MLQAMNTGHDGSLTTIHANTPRDALSRIETMIAMGATNLPERAMRQQIAAAIQIVIQQSRMSDGTRKVTSISEVTGMEDVITMQEIFSFEKVGVSQEGRVIGRFRATGDAAEGVRAAQGVGGPRRRHVRRRHGGPVMVIVLVLLAFVVGVALVMGGYTAIAKLPQMLLQRRLDTRLQEVSQPIERGRRHQHEDAGEGPERRTDPRRRSHPGQVDQGLDARQVDRSVGDAAVAERRRAGRTRARPR